MAATNNADIDVLFIDAEGSDSKVLQMFMEIPDFLPSVITYEHKHLNRTQADDARQLLRNLSYCTGTQSGNDVAIKKGVLSKIIQDQ